MAPLLGSAVTAPVGPPVIALEQPAPPTAQRPMTPTQQLQAPEAPSCAAGAAAATSRYRALRGKSVSSLRPFDIFRDGGQHSSTSTSTGLRAPPVTTSSSSSTATASGNGFSGSEHDGRTGSSGSSSDSSSRNRSSSGSSHLSTSTSSGGSQLLQPDAARRRSKTVSANSTPISLAPARHATATAGAGATPHHPPPPPPPRKPYIVGLSIDAPPPPPPPPFSTCPTASALSPRPVNAALKPSLTALESLKAPIESASSSSASSATPAVDVQGWSSAPATLPPVTAASPTPRPPPPTVLVKGEARRVAAKGEQDDGHERGSDSTRDSPNANTNDTRDPNHDDHDDNDKDDLARRRNADRDSGKVITPPTPEQPALDTEPRKHSPAWPHCAPLGDDRQPVPHQDKEAASRLAARLEAETDRILAEQKKLDLARLQSQPLAPASRAGRRPLFDKFAFLSRARRSNAKAVSQPGTPSTVAPSIFSPTLASVSQYSRSSSVDDSSSSPPKMSFIEPGGKGIVPQFDAPTSAINGGERRVIVRCLSSTITLPITAETSPTQIVQSAAKMTNHVVTPTTCVVIECYFMLGLERRLRRYERVRDVLNSWDNDEQNSLIILPCDSPKEERGLDMESVPRTEESPPGFCLQLYHSARPGKWHKRWVTLMDGGQMFASKRPEAGPADKDSTVLCHLSDFDIYMPKESEMRRNLKPPKKFCYAIKSQQKTFVFPNGENFVHFFCTDDAKVASRFHDVVHGWRSWYLVNRMVNLARKDKPPQIAYNLLQVSKSPKNSSKGVEKSPQVSIDEMSYKSEEPLMDVKGFKVPEGPFIVETPPAKRLLKESSGQKASAPPLPDVDGKQREFAAGGLLGDAYDKRKQEEVANTHTRVDEDKQQGRPATADAGAHLRRDKHPHHHQPLLSFGKDFPEPPRFRDGHGHGPRHASGQPLINFATGGPQNSHHGPLPHRTMSRRGVSASNSAPPMPPLPHGVRNRSRSAGGPASVSSGSSRRYFPDEAPPVPALPNRSGRRDRFAEPPHGGPPGRHPEPLVNHAR
ncbi:hypothetical protein HIM_05509 [Hirsutella minnesotensis 3608]|uniref:PH domain-containing protein n=1 Tax=Hirsutella minnesotensis 3608 TaxID=1043627 RepID=A0A0F7ZUK5_9HYPO|nr:hypothetical protein HIM_05509 [Hirsutella minnesotensis 3608]